jgi:hypothetical protein
MLSAGSWQEKLLEVVGLETALETQALTVKHCLTGPAVMQSTFDALVAETTLTCKVSTRLIHPH